MAYYNVCPLCGANLDPGEKCDCEDERDSMRTFYMESTRVEPMTGQTTFLLDGKEFDYETKIAN